MNPSKSSESSQTTIEFALILPLAVAIGLLFLQLGLIVKAQITLTHSTREGARALALYYDEFFYKANTSAQNLNFSQQEAKSRAIQVVLEASNLDPARTQVDISFISPNLAEIKVTYKAETSVLLVGDWISDINLSSSLKVAVFDPNLIFQEN